MEYTSYLIIAALVFCLIGFMAGRGAISFGSSVVIFIVLLIAAPLMFNLFIWFYAGQTEEVFAPDVMGLKSDVAISRLEGSGLHGVISGVTFSGKPEGIVISQRPEGGKKVKSGRTVSLIISAKDNYVTVPNLIGLSREAAEGMASSSGLSIGVIQEVASDEPPDTIIDQSPKSPETVPRGSSVSIFISTGNRQ